jgi:hypothetical protein
MKNMQETRLCTRWELESNPKEEPGRETHADSTQTLR